MYSYSDEVSPAGATSDLKNKYCVQPNLLDKYSRIIKGTYDNVDKSHAHSATQLIAE